VRPTATSIIASGAVTTVALTGAVSCTVAPILTIARPNSDDSEYISLHADKTFLNVALTGSTPNCTSQNKCEWFCPTATPFYCGVTNTCIAQAIDCCPSGQSYCPTTNSCVVTGSCASCSTSAPSELKAGVDQPYISCGAVDSKTHFRYRIISGSGIGGTTATATAQLGTGSIQAQIVSGGSGYTTAPVVTVTFTGTNCSVPPQGTATVSGGSVTAITITGTCSIPPTIVIAAPPVSSNTYTSTNSYLNGTQVKHPFTLDVGTYTVVCMYGNSSTPVESMTTSPVACAKPMVVTANSTK
jgi:hypothetical protein